MATDLEIAHAASPAPIEEIAWKEENVLKFLNKKPKKVIIIPNRVVNFVI